MGKKLKIKYNAPKSKDISHSQANIELAKRDLNFIPEISLEDGLTQLLR